MSFFIYRNIRFAYFIRQKDVTTVFVPLQTYVRWNFLFMNIWHTYIAGSKCTSQSPSFFSSIYVCLCLLGSTPFRAFPACHSSTCPIPLVSRIRSHICNSVYIGNEHELSMRNGNVTHVLEIALPRSDFRRCAVIGKIFRYVSSTNILQYTSMFLAF